MALLPAEFVPYRSPILKKLLQTLNTGIEDKLDLHGCSAIEDKLQEGIDVALPRIKQAGIK